MNRRTLILKGIVVVGGSFTGCLENREPMDDSADSEGDTTSTDSTDGGDQRTDDKSTDDSHTDRNPTSDTDGVHETQFEVLGSDFDFKVSASVTFENDSVTVSGTIQGYNTCYTARLDETTIENRMLTVNIDSYEDSDENEGCGLSLIGIKYKGTVEFDGDLPTEVTVKHNGKHVTTEQAS